MKIGLDSNFLIYAEGVNDDARRAICDQIIARIHERLIVPLLALGEFYRVLVRKAKWQPVDAAKAVDSWIEGFEVQSPTVTTLRAAVELSADHKLHVWDSLILATCAEAGCQFVLSEDLQHGFNWRGLEILNPFKEFDVSFIARLER